ncbi:MAG TPA: hypothetical protein VH307_25795 [Streptosporangiaceae bacterium]|nr:hypothetical protein [Streptosporangiaceae bacterium]
MRPVPRDHHEKHARAAVERDSRLAADTELAQRERRVRHLEIRPLSEGARRDYALRWAAIQEQFVDSPQAAMTDGQALVASMMNERGYPTDDHEQVVADLSVEHARTVDHFRSAHEISRQAAPGGATTEDLRRAMIHYRELFGDLLGGPSGEQDGRPGTSVGLLAADAGFPDQTVPDAEAEAVPGEPDSAVTQGNTTPRPGR